MEDSPTSSPDRKPYERPVVRTIELALEEVMSAGCKTSGGGTAPLASPCVSVPCGQAGS